MSFKMPLDNPDTAARWQAIACRCACCRRENDRPRSKGRTATIAAGYECLAERAMGHDAVEHLGVSEPSRQ